jgi:hypothetical protein
MLIKKNRSSTITFHHTVLKFKEITLTMKHTEWQQYNIRVNEKFNRNLIPN